VHRLDATNFETSGFTRPWESTHTMIGFLRNLLSTDFMPHGYCLRLSEVIWLHEISDLVIALSYFLIPLALIYLIRVRRDLLYPWMFLLFGLFIVSCGATHVLSVVVLWHPVYRLDGLVKAITALASFPTALLLFRLLPEVKRIPSAQRFETRTQCSPMRSANASTPNK
jgi:hypothetical protein